MERFQDLPVLYRYWLVREKVVENPVLGRVAGLALDSVFCYHSWTPGWNAAICVACRSTACSQHRWGFHGMYRLPALLSILLEAMMSQYFTFWNTAQIVIGKIAVAGEVVFAEYGARATRAQVIGILGPGPDRAWVFPMDRIREMWRPGDVTTMLYLEKLDLLLQVVRRPWPVMAWPSEDFPVWELSWEDLEQAVWDSWTVLKRQNLRWLR